MSWSAFCLLVKSHQNMKLKTKNVEMKW
jgi:hypothetical protein